MQDIPLIDVSPLAGVDATAKRAVARDMGIACREVGFFYVAGHGIPAQMVADVFAGAKQFFALPQETKRLFPTRNNRGYSDLSDEKLDPDADEDRKEAFNIGLELPPGDPDAVAGVHGRGVNIWPDLPGWRGLMLGYFDACWALGRMLHRGFSIDLGVAEDFFENKLDAPLAVLRMLHYPARDPSVQQAFGAGAHTDYGNVTILATDGVAGLQVRHRSSGWIDAPTVPGAFICNIGDCLMRWTNDIYVSTPHRVLVPEQARYSLAFFLDPNPDAIVAPIALEGAPKYAPVTAEAYVRERLDATYLAPKGK